MNSELYFCQLSDLIISKQANTVMTAEGKITNLLPEEALIEKINLFKPLPWTKYSDQEVKHYLKQIKTNRWISLSQLNNELLIGVQQKYRLKILNNFFRYECKTWKELKTEGSTTHIKIAEQKLLIKSISSTETYLSIPRRFSSLSREISLPTNISLLIDPYFQDKYFKAVLLWIELMTKSSNDSQPSTNQTNECLELVKVILQDIGNSVVDISNEIDTINFDNQKYFTDRSGKFSFILDYKTGFSIQLIKKNNYKLRTHIRNLDLDPITFLDNTDQWINILQDLMQMHMFDINLQKNLNI